jgi:hypothetical protein
MAVRCFALLVSFTLAAPAQSAEKVEYTSKEGQFKAVFKAKPTEKEEKVLGLIVKIAFLETPDGMFAIAFSDLPKRGRLLNNQIERGLDMARDVMLKSVKATLVKEEQIKLEKKYPGRDVTGEMPFGSGMIRSRIYAVDGRVYQIMVGGTGGFVKGTDAESFLSSFWLTK